VGRSAPIGSDEGGSDPWRAGRRRRKLRKRRRRWFAALVIFAVLAPVTYSYVTTMIKPSSLPLSIRTVEWIRENHGAWAVNAVERYWYTWHAPKKGGPTLTTLPTVGTPVEAAPAAPVLKHRVVVDWRPSRLPPLIRPALPGEGAWHKVAAGPGRRAPVLVTTFRSEADYPRIVAYVAWIDHTRTQLALYPGRYEPPNASPRGPIEVPPGQRGRLLATFNSGFTYKDGHGGFAVNGSTATPFQDGLGTVVAYRSGRVDVMSWRGRSTPGRRVVLARQNLPLLVQAGRPNPTIDNGNAWGDTLGNAVRVWRSGIGIDRHGNLIYAAADYQTARTLAAILIHAGAVRAIELDINAEWPSFITYPLPGGRDPVKLVPNYQQPATRYLVSDDRDFFAIYARVPHGPTQVPFR
jgi:Phosphodiester glycosidase